MKYGGCKHGGNFKSCPACNDISCESKIIKMRQLTDEIRLAIFQQNIGSEITSIKNGGKHKICGMLGNQFVADLSRLSLGYPKDFSILKRPLSSITDEEAEEVANIFGLENAKVSRLDNDIILSNNTEGSDICIWFDGEIIPDREDFGGNGHPVYLHAYQYLHSRGFALPYLDWSVEDLVKENVYKIIE